MTINASKNRIPVMWSIINTPSVPVLKMIINPNNMDFNYTTLVTETRTLGGFIQEYWGEQLTTISASGQIAMFVGAKGITNKDSRSTESYQNFMRLLNIYKNNGREYVTTPKNPEQYRNPNKITGFQGVLLEYQEKQYEGFFENFTFKETADKPFTLEYSLAFKVTRTIGNLRVSNGRFINGSF